MLARECAVHVQGVGPCVVACVAGALAQIAVVVHCLRVVAVERCHALAVVVVETEACLEAQPVGDACVQERCAHHAVELCLTVEVFQDERGVVALNPVFR